MQILLDYKFLLLSTNISISIILLGLVLAFLDNKISVVDSIIGLCLGYGFLWLLNLVFRTIKSKDGIGDGDFIFLAALCTVLGYKLLGPIILGGSVVSLSIYFMSAKKNKLLPFGTGMGFATVFIIFFI